MFVNVVVYCWTVLFVYWVVLFAAVFSKLMVVLHNQFWCFGCYIIICIFLVDSTKWFYWWIKLQEEIHWSKIAAENFVEGVAEIDAEALFGVGGEAIKVKKGGGRRVEDMWGRGRKERHGMFWCFLSWMLCSFGA